jgi:hypothetical protein
MSHLLLVHDDEVADEERGRELLGRFVGVVREAKG